jgi:hypothetical protein
VNGSNGSSLVLSSSTTGAANTIEVASVATTMDWRNEYSASASANYTVIKPVEVYLRDCIAEPLRLFGRIASVMPDGRVKVRFVAPGETFAICWRGSRSASTAARSPECGSRRRDRLRPGSLSG